MKKLILIILMSWTGLFAGVSDTKENSFSYPWLAGTIKNEAQVGFWYKVIPPNHLQGCRFKVSGDVELKQAGGVFYVKFKKIGTYIIDTYQKGKMIVCPTMCKVVN